MPSTRPNTPTADDRRGPIQSRHSPNRVLPPAVAVGVFLLCGLLGAQQPKAIVTGPKEARCGALVVLDATASEGVGRLWLLAVSPEETSFLPVESSTKCLFASPVPGRYEFVLIVAGTNANGGPAADMSRHSVTLTGAAPPPNPPDPPTPPVPTAGRRLIVILRESADSDTETATTILRLRTDPQLLDRLKSKNHPPPLVLDPDSSDPLVQRLIREIGSSQRPALAVLDYSAGEAGKTISVVPVPTDVAGVIDALGKAGG